MASNQQKLNFNVDLNVKSSTKHADFSIAIGWRSCHCTVGNMQRIASDDALQSAPDLIAGDQTMSWIALAVI
jgi:hypothetical protein